MIGGAWEAAGAASLPAAVACAVATTIIIAVGTLLCGWRAALGGIGPALLAGAVISYYGSYYGPALMGSRFDVDRFLLGLTLLLCGGVPVAMALFQEKRARACAAGRGLAVPPRRRKRARTGASP
jgi:hypothetical protein